MAFQFPSSMSGWQGGRTVICLTSCAARRRLPCYVLLREWQEEDTVSLSDTVPIVGPALIYFSGCAHPDPIFYQKGSFLIEFWCSVRFAPCGAARCFLAAVYISVCCPLVCVMLLCCLIAILDPNLCILLSQVTPPCSQKIENAVHVPLLSQ